MADWIQEEIDALPQEAVDACIANGDVIIEKVNIGEDTVRVFHNNGIRLHLTGQAALDIINAVKAATLAALQSKTP